MYGLSVIMFRSKGSCQRWWLLFGRDFVMDENNEKFRKDPNYLKRLETGKSVPFVGVTIKVVGNKVDKMCFYD